MTRLAILVLLGVQVLFLLPSCRQAPLDPVAQDTGARSSQEALRSFHYLQMHMGVDVHLELWAESAQRARAAARAAFARVGAIDGILSDYRPDSEARRLCARAGEGPVAVGPELLEVMGVAADLNVRTGGAFDVTIGPVSRLWRRARNEGRPPSAKDLAAARELVGFGLVTLDREAGTMTLARPGMQLDFGAIGKGYACDQAIDVLAMHGVTRALCLAGGDIVASGPPPGEDGWRVEMPGREEAWSLMDGALSISGDSAQYLEADGVRYSHVILPATGAGVSSRAQAIVRAPLGILSDPLATCGTLLDEEAFQELLAGYPGVTGEVR